MAADKSPISPSNDSKSASPPDKIQERQDGPDSTASTAEEKSTEARNRGNDLYRKGLFDEATKAYFEALSLTPNDSAPLSNLSAVQFELGNYPGSALYAEKALKLLQDEADSNPKKQKLLSRLARAQILQLKDAAPLVSKLASSDTTRSSATTQHGGQRESVTWTKLLDEIPRYRPTLETEPEYYPVGHDCPHPELDEAMLSLKQDLSWLFAGIGDARNFFMTLFALSANVSTRDSSIDNRFHFTLIDLKPAAIAKILIMLHLLNQTRDTEAMACAIYVFGSLIMPSFAYNKLQQTIADLIDRCEKGVSFSDWIYVSRTQTPAILHQLLAWKSHLHGKYETRDFREGGLLDASRAKAQAIRSGQGVMYLPFCEHDDKLFWTYGIVLPDDANLLKHETKLAHLVKDVTRATKAPPTVSQEALELIDKTWKPNVTLVDVDWDVVLETDRPRSNAVPNFCFDTPAVAQRLFNPTEDQAREVGLESFWAWFNMFFDLVSRSINTLRSQMCVELVAGEMNDCLERLQHKAWSTRGEKQGKLDPSGFPKTYNRINMSNVPDYVGGHLSTFLYAIPLLYPDQSSAVNSRVLLNTSTWSTHEHLLTEYTMLTDVKSVEQCFNVKLRQDSSSLTDWGQPELELSDYTMWTVGSSKPLRSGELMARHVTEKYFQAHLLKICLPYTRSKWTTNFDVRSPLNLTMLFRLIIHFHNMGYPSHWLSEILGNMLEGVITTTTRAPRQTAMTIKEARRTYPSMSICTKPWLAELSTFASIWQHLLPFGLLFDSNLLPALDGITSYSIKLPPPPKGDCLERAVFALVFWDTSRGSPPSDLRKTLLDDEQGDRSKSAKSIRESGVHVLTTFKWLQKTNTASFWVRSDVVETMQQGDWKAYIWRLDEWIRVTTGVSVKEHIQAGATWTDDEVKLPIRPSPKQEASNQPSNATTSAPETATASKAATPEEQTSSTSSIPAHISNDVDRKLVREFQVSLSHLASIVATDAKEPGLPKSIRRERQEYVRVVDGLRRRADPSFTPPKPTEFKKWPLLDLLYEVRGAELLVVGANLLPKNMYCQKHICKLVAGKVPSLATPSKESLKFMEGFDEHFETRKRYDAWKEKESKERRSD